MPGKKDFFTDMIECLEIESETSKYAILTPDTMKELYSDFPDSAEPESPSVPKRSMPDVTHMGLSELEENVSNCTLCNLCAKRTNTVFGEGNPSARLMFIGEGPGRDEDLQGRPFVGKAGQLLTKMINAMGFKREEVYIANIVKCRPPGNRNPEPEEAEKCLPYLNRQIELIKPEVIVMLGAVPLLFLTGQKGIMRLHGQWSEYKGVKTLATYHPAFLLRNPASKKEAWEDLQKAMKELGMPLPSK